MEANEAMKAMARRIADDHTGPNNRGNYLWEPRYDAALAAIMETQRLDSLIASCQFDDRARGRNFDWTDGYQDACNDVAAHIRAGEHYALAGGGRG